MSSDVEDLLKKIKTEVEAIGSFATKVPGGYWIREPDEGTAKPFVRFGYQGMTGTFTDDTGDRTLAGPVQTYAGTFTVVGPVAEALLDIVQLIEIRFVNALFSPSLSTRVIAAYKVGDELEADPDRDDDGNIVWNARLQMEFQFQRGAV